MKKTHDQLIKILADALKVNETEAAGELRVWVNKIDKKLSEDGQYFVEGLGTFKIIHGEIIFQPESSLELEVNYKYAGMKPLDISRPEVQKPEEKEEERGQEEEKKGEEEKMDTKEEEGDPEELTETGPGVPETPSRIPPEDKPDPIEEEDAEDEKPGMAIAEEEHARPETPETNVITETSKKEKSMNTDYENETPKSGKKISKTWLIPVIALIIVAILLFFHFDGLKMEQDVFVEEKVVTEEPVVVTIEDKEEPAEEPEEASPYGLMGPEDEILKGSYTIVLHSIYTERRARQEKQNFEEKGYKATLWEVRLSEGYYTWRIGVGQFKTVADAEKAVSKLPEPYKSNNFIIRIR